MGSQSRIAVALGHHQAGRLSEAEAAYRDILSVEPDDIDALHFLGVVAYQQGKHDQAAELISRALMRNAFNATAHNNLGNVWVALGKPSEAITCYRQALVLSPEYIDALVNLGTALVLQGKLDEAIASLRKALALKPDVPHALSHLAGALSERGQLDEAVACCHRELALRPDSPEAHFVLANAFRRKGQWEEAVARYERAIELNGAFPEAHFNLGCTLRTLDRGQEAIDCLRKALSVNPEYAEARWVLTTAQIPAVYPDGAHPSSFREEFSRELDEMDRWFDGTRSASGYKAVSVDTPFYLAYQEHNNRDLLKRYGALCARLMGEWFDRQGLVAPVKARPDTVRRIGVVSHCFRYHSVWNAVVKGWFQQLDSNRFSLHAFHLGDKVDQETSVARSRASHFVEGRKDLREWVEIILGQRLDVLMYPEIGMESMTARLASLRLAPVQIASWGHPETSGLPTIDYYLSAELLEPPDAKDNYTERLIALPNLGCYYEPVQSTPVSPDLASFGIDLKVPLLLCPGAPFKYLPEYDWVFAEIARGLGSCRLVFFTHSQRGLSEKLRQRLGAAFSAHGLDIDDYVIFIPWLDWPTFHGLMQRADVFLDTIGFSGFNTAVEAIGCGLPIVSREGRFMRGRLGSGVLKRIGLQELVVASEKDYVAAAIRLAKDVEYRQRVRQRISATRHRLFEDAAPIRAMESFLLSL